MGELVMSSQTGSQRLEVRLLACQAIEVPSLARSGPVEVFRVDVSTDEDPDRLGEAPSAQAALELWPQLRYVGGQVAIEGATDAICDSISEILTESPVVAPPDGWFGGAPSFPFEVFINGDSSMEWGSVYDLDADQLASVGSDYGAFSISFIDGWLIDSGSDEDDTCTWIGTDVPEQTLAEYGEDLVLSPPMWPSGTELRVSISGLDPDRAASILAVLTDGRLDGYYEALSFNGRSVSLV
jgi:hypothetical protein